MGSILNRLKDHKKRPKKSLLLNQWISEIKEQWMQFKTRCDDFWIDFEEFHRIFKQEIEVFSQWDSKENGLIDVLELFSCLIVYSQSSFEDKMTLLFEIFDFNGLYCLTVIDIEYMVNSCVSSILKINHCFDGFEIEQDRISHLVNQSFKSGDIINLSVFLRFCTNNESISDFMKIIQQPFPEKEEISLFHKIERLENPNNVIPEYLRSSQQTIHPESIKASTNNLFFQQLLNTQYSFNRKSFVLNTIDRIQNFSHYSSEKQSTLNLKWIFGFRYKDLVHSVLYHHSNETSHSTSKMTEKLIFFSGKVVVVYYHKLNKQLLYNEHINRISSLTISSDNTLCASADYGKYPKVNIWSIETLKTKMNLSVISNSIPYLLKFINNDTHLVVVLKRPLQPVLIYNVLMGLVSQTISIESFLYDLIPIYNIIPQIDNSMDLKHKLQNLKLDKCFIGYSQQSIHLFFYCQKSFKHELNSFKIDMNEADSITCAFGLFSSIPDPDLAVYSPSRNYDLSIIIGLSNGRLMMINNTYDPRKIKMTEIRNFQSKIKFVVFLKSKLLVVYTENFMLNFIDFFTKKITNKIALNSCNHKLDCYEIHHMERIDQKRLLLVTQSGEVLWINLKEFLEWDNGILKPKIKSKIESGIIGFPNQSPLSCLLEMDNGEHYVFIYCDNHILYTLSMTQHKIVNKWICPESISTMDVFYNKVLGIVNCLGCHTGTLIIRIQWNKILEKFDCKSEIISVKFSETGKHLLVSLKNCSVLVFTRKNGLYFKDKEIRFHIPNEMVLKFNFNDKCEQQSDAFVILTTNLNNHFYFLLYRKNPYQPLFVNTVCNNRIISLSFSTEQIETKTPFLLTFDPFYLVCGEQSGTITLFDSVEGYKNQLTGYYNGHSSSVTQLMISNKLNLLYSLCGLTGELFQWKIQVENVNSKSENSLMTKYFYQGHDSVLNQINAVQIGCLINTKEKEIDIQNRNTLPIHHFNSQELLPTNNTRLHQTHAINPRHNLHANNEIHKDNHGNYELHTDKHVNNEIYEDKHVNNEKNEDKHVNNEIHEDKDVNDEIYEDKDVNNDNHGRNEINRINYRKNKLNEKTNKPSSKSGIKIGMKYKNEVIRNEIIEESMSEKPIIINNESQNEKNNEMIDFPKLESVDSEELKNEMKDQRMTEKQINKTQLVSTNATVECDSFAYFRSFNNSDLRKVYSNRAPISNESKDVIKKMFLEYSLRLKYVYGLSAYEFTGMCLYIHTTFEIIPLLSSTISSDQSSQQRYTEYNYSKFNNKFDRSSDYQNKFKPIVNNSIKLQTKDMFGEFLEEDSVKDTKRIKDSFFDGQVKVKKTKEKKDQKLRRKYKSNYPSVLMENELSTFLKKINCNGYIGDACNHFSFSHLLNNYGRCYRNDKDCYRQILYVVSKIVVISDPLQIHQQRFYEGHSAQISVLVRHQFHNLVATGEIAINPRIHIWNPTFAMTVSIVITGHQSGILLLEFFNFENMIISVSTDSTNSLQISDWKTANCLAFRNTSNKRIVSVKSNPVLQSSFITGSVEQIDFWELKSHNLVHIKSISLNSESFHGHVNSLTYFNYECLFQSRVDILVTSSYGQIGLISNNEYVSLTHKFDKMIISVIKSVVIDGSVFVFVGSEDGSIRGYTIGFQKVFEWKESEKFQNPKFKTRGIQSIDFYLCDSNGICLLAMTRHGKIMELELSFQRDVFQNPKFVDKTNQRDSQSNNISRKEKVLVQSHVAQTIDDSNDSTVNFRENKKVLIALNRERDILASVGDDENLFVWDIKTCAPVKILSLQMTPTAIKFGPNNRLIIGFNNGKVKIYDLEFMVSFDLGNVFTVVVKENPFVIFDPDIQTGVLNLELSDKGERLAVSYDILRVEHEVENRKKAMEGFAVSIYQLVTKSTGGMFSQDGPYKHFDELRPSILNQFEMSKIIFQNMAVHNMSFSEDFVHLFIYLQKMQQSQLRNVRDQEGQFIMRNITTQQLQNLTDNDYLPNFNRVVFPSHVNGIRLLVDLKNNKDIRKPIPFFSEVTECGNNKITLSAICDSEKIVIMGSVTGELFLSRSTMFAIGNSNSPNEFRLTDMIQAKTYPAHTSFVNQIEIDNFQKYVFSTGINDECIYQWEIERTEDIPDPDVISTVGSLDKFCQDIPNKYHFFDLIRLIYPMRMNITKILSDIDKQVLPRIKLDLFKVIGRKAMARRGNLISSYDNKLIYCTGTLAILIGGSSNHNKPILIQKLESSELIIDDHDIHNKESQNDFIRKSNKLINSISVVMNKHKKKSENTFGIKNSNCKQSTVYDNQSKTSCVNLHFQFKNTLKNSENNKPNPSLIINNKSNSTKSTLISQSFIIPSNNKDLIPPSEISCMELTIDKKVLCVGTSNHVSVLHFYDVASVSYIGVVILEQCKLPIFMRFSVDNKNLFLCGLDVNYKVSVFFINVEKYTLTAVINFLYSEPHWIRDGQFYPISNDRFILVGPCQITSWKYSCNILNFKQLVTKPFSGNEKKLEFKKQDLKFESVCISIQFIFSNVFVCGSLTGHLFLWRNEICETKTVCYSNMPVLVICKSPFKKGEIIRRILDRII